MNLTLIIIVILIITISLITVTHSDGDDFGWEFKDAVAQCKLLTDKYGEPSNIDKSKGGMAIWHRDKLKKTCFNKIVILDESVAHCVPKPHRDFLYTYVKYEIPEDKVLDVTSLSGSVAYDPLKKTLRARCGSEEANIATLYLAVSIGNSKITLSEVQENELYKKTIESTVSAQNVELYYNKLCKLLKNQPGNPDWTGYYTLAFPDGCCDGYDPHSNKCDSKLVMKTSYSSGGGGGGSSIDASFKLLSTSGHDKKGSVDDGSIEAVII